MCKWNPLGYEWTTYFLYIYIAEINSFPFILCFFLQGCSFQQDLTTSALISPVVRKRSVHVVYPVYRIQPNAGRDMSPTGITIALPNVLNTSHFVFAFSVSPVILGVKEAGSFVEESDRALGFFLYLCRSLWTVTNSRHGLTPNCEDLLLRALPWVQTFRSIMDGSDSALRTSGV